MDEPKIRFEKYKEPLTSRLIGDIYTERKESGDETLPILTVSIHSGVSDGALDDEDLGKRVQRSEDKTKYKRAEKDDVVFNMMRAWQGAIGVVRTTGMVSPAYIVAKPDDSVYPLFMDYYLKSPQMIKTINKLSYGLMDFRKRLYWDSFASINCMLPSLEEQKDICELLERIEHVIIHNENELKKWIELKKGMLQKMFPSKGMLVPTVRFPDFSGNWQRKRMGEILIEFSNKSKEEDEYPILSSTNTGMEHRIGRVSGASNIGYKIISNNDLVLSPQNLWLGNININDMGTGIVSPSYKTFKIVDVDVDFLLPQLRTSNLMNAYLEASTQGASVVRRNLDIDRFYEICICVPSYEEQYQIGQYFKNLDSILALHKQEVNKWKELKKGLLQQMFV